MATGKRSAGGPGWRRLQTIGLCAVALVAVPLPARAHGVGGLSNLPAPLSFFLAGVATVLIVSFAQLTLRWPNPRWQVEAPIRPIKVPGWRWMVSGLRGFGIAGLIVVVASGVFGVPNSIRNPGPVLVWVGFWLVLPIAGAFLGDLYRLLNPWRTLAALFGPDSIESSPASGSVGGWPATVMFLGFVWFELIYPNPDHPRHLAVAVICYTVLLLGISERLGPRAAIGRWDAFATYNRLISAIAPLDLDPDRGPGWRGWLRGLPMVPESPAVAAFVVAILGGVAFHGMSSSAWYETAFGEFGASRAGSTVMLLSTVGVVATAFLLVCGYAARQAAGTQSAFRLATGFSHILVPIAFAFVVAHYFTAVAFEGQLLLSTISDPFGLGWNLFGTARRSVDFTWLSHNQIWWIQVVTIVAGHLAALTLVHDRSLRDFDGRGGVRARYSFLLLVILFAAGGLTILATG